MAGQRKNKKVYPLICIQGSTTFEFYCQCVWNIEKSNH